MGGVRCACKDVNRARDQVIMKVSVIVSVIVHVIVIVRAGVK